MRDFWGMKKTAQLTLKLTENDFDLLKNISDETGCSAQALIRQMINAVRKQWTLNGRISLPIALADDVPARLVLSNQDDSKGKKS